MKVYLLYDDEDLAAAQPLIDELQVNGYQPTHPKTVLPGESVVSHAKRALEAGIPIVLFATPRSVGSERIHRIVNAANSRGRNRIFIVKLHGDTFTDHLGFGEKIADYSRQPAEATEDLLASLKTHYPPLKIQPTDIVASGDVRAAEGAEDGYLDGPISGVELDPEAFKLYRSSLKEGLDAIAKPTLLLDEVLERLSVLNSKKLTRTAVLLFGLNPQAVLASATIQCVHYDGIDKSAFRDSTLITGNVQRQVMDAYEFVRARVRKAEVPNDEKLSLETRYAYPMTCLREVIVNAVVHRDYSDAARKTHVRLFDNRIEVVSPGKWTGKVLANEPTPLSQLAGQSISRNPRLAHCLSLIAFYEGEGSGIPKALSSSREVGALEPTAQNDEGFVTITIWPGSMAASSDTPESSTSSSRLLGLVMPDVLDPFYSEVAAAVEHAARAKGYLLTVANSESRPENEQDILRSFCERGVDGLLVIAAPGADHQFLDSEFHMGKRVVFIDREPQNLPADFISSDNLGGARVAVEHLIEHGHERIGVLVGDTTVWTDDKRLQGYKDALAAHGIRYDAALVKTGCRDIPTAELATYQLLLGQPGPPTAIFAYNNRSAIGAFRAITETQKPTVLVGFDNFELADTLSLTVVAQDTFKLGSLATEILLRRLSGEEFDIQDERIPTWLIPRGSGEKAPPKAATDNPTQGGSSDS